MKVLIAGFATPDSFADNVAYTLREMGHEPFVAPARLHPTSARRFIERACKATGVNTPTRVEKWLLRTAAAYRPEMLLAPTQSISDRTLGALRDLGVRRLVAWWGDPPGNLRGMDLLSERWDLVCLKDGACVDKLRRVGTRAMYLPEAMNPAWHRPIADVSNDRVAVAGNYYGYRQYLVRQLTRRGVTFDLYGSQPPRWSVPEVRRQYRGRYIVREDKSRVFGEALACLNSASFAEGNSMNCRAFEVAGAGGLQVIEDKPIIQEFFEPGKELLVFNSIEECVAHIDRAARCASDVARIRAAGARRAAAEHTYRHRLTTLFSWLDES